MTATTSIPLSPADVTADWLSSVLSNISRPVVVTDVEVTPIGTGQTGATYRVSATYAGDHDGLPDTFVVKLPSQEADVRERVALGYRSEHAFYTQVADTVRIPLPRCFHCDIADTGAQFVLLLSDLALAGLHGPRWCDPAWLTFSGTVMPKPDDASAAGFGELARMAADKTLDGWDRA
jgi:hypothetical protein